MKKSKYVEAWLHGIKKLFRFHTYSEDIKVKITTFIIKGKENIRLEDFKNVKGI